MNMKMDARFYQEIARQRGKETIKVVRGILVLLQQLSLVMAQVGKMCEKL